MNIFGTTSFFPFSIPIESAMSFTKFSVEANGAQGVYAVQTSGFVVL